MLTNHIKYYITVIIIIHSSVANNIILPKCNIKTSIFYKAALKQYVLWIYAAYGVGQTSVFVSWLNVISICCLTSLILCYLKSRWNGSSNISVVCYISE